MSDGPRRQTSFSAFVKQDKSVEVSTDQLKGQIQHQSTDQLLSPYLFPNPFISYDGSFADFPQVMNQKTGFINSSLDSKIWLKQREEQPRYFPIFHHLSPVASFMPFIAEMAIQQQIPPQPPKQHFQNNDLKLLQQSVESEEIINEESDWEKPKAKQRRRSKMDDSSESYKVSRKKKTSKVNDTKNITKNYSKAIISYIISNPDFVQQFMDKKRYDEFVNMLKSKKNSMTNIKQLRDLWVDGGKNQDFNKVFRIISNYFLRRQSIAYVYNSRISNTIWHLKYRYNLQRALHEPDNFKFIKDI